LRFAVRGCRSQERKSRFTDGYSRRAGEKLRSISLFKIGRKFWRAA
jgi:hypothetical protein